MTPTQPVASALAELTRPIIGIENRTAQEAFDIMADRFRGFLRTPTSTEEAAIRQNDAMRQELAHVGNLISDLARAMRIDQANADGSWPDLAGRVQKLIAALPVTTGVDRGAVLEEALAEAANAIDQLERGMQLVPERMRPDTANARALLVRIRALSPPTETTGEDSGEEG